MQNRKRYRKKEENKKLRPAPVQVMKEKIFDTRKGLKKFLKRKFG